MTTHHHGKTELAELCRERSCPTCGQPLRCGGSNQTGRYCTVLAVCKPCAFVEDFYLHGGKPCEKIKIRA